jgi:hypothetical protein
MDQQLANSIIKNLEAQIIIVESQIKLYQEMRRINQEYITVLEDRIKKLEKAPF